MTPQPPEEGGGFSKFGTALVATLPPIPPGHAPPPPPRTPPRPADASRRPQGAPIRRSSKGGWTEEEARRAAGAVAVPRAAPRAAPPCRPRLPRRPRHAAPAAVRRRPRAPPARLCGREGARAPGLNAPRADAAPARPPQDDILRRAVALHNARNWKKIGAPVAGPRRRGRGREWTASQAKAAAPFPTSPGARRPRAPAACPLSLR